jgi:recombination protein RecT
MAQKTVLRRLLSKYGFLSIEMMNALSDDEQPQFNAEAIRDEENHEARPVINASQMMQDAEEVKAEEVKEEANSGTPEPDDKPNF